MKSMGVLAAVCLMGALNASLAQEPSSAGPNEVTEVSIKSGKLALSSAANPGPVFLPDGAYMNDASTTIVIVHGRIVRVEYGSGTAVQVASIRLTNERVMLTPPVTALMQVQPIPLPSGIFRSKDGSSSLKVVSARPTEFVVSASAPQS